jgi:serine protease
MTPARALSGLLAAASAAAAFIATPHATAQQPQPLAPPARAAALAPVDGEVIVRFKADASTLRKHALSARAAPAVSEAVIAERAQALGTRLGRTLEHRGAVSDQMQVVRSAGLSAAELAASLAADPEVEFAVPNGRMRRLAAPNDPLYPVSTRPNGPDSGQWYLRAPTAATPSAIDIETAWARTTGSAGIVVAVLDTGVRFEHPDLQQRLVPGYDFVGNATVANDGDGRDADASDPGDWVTSADAATSTFSNCSVENSSWHGTATASLVGASTNDAVGMAGSAPHVRVQPVRVLGKCYGSDSDIQAAMRWAAGLSVPGVPDNPTPAKVINMSLGGTGSCSAAYQSTINEVIARGVIVVAAAGNSAGGPVGTPANCSGVIAVLALRHAGTKVGFSDLGPQIAIAAPGGNCINVTTGSACLYPILAATNAGTQGPAASIWSDSFRISVGTSFASPLVAGVVGLMTSVNPALTPAQVRTRLQSTARPFPTTGGDNGPGDPTPVTACQAPSANVEQLQCYCNTTYCGAGMLDAGAAVAAAVAGPYVTIGMQPAAPQSGDSVRYTITGLATANAQPVLGYAWTLLPATTAAIGFSSATNADTATLTTSGSGVLGVQLTVTDTANNVLGASQTVTVAGTGSGGGTTPPPSNGGGSSGGGGGGGATSAPWLLALLLAAGALRAARRRA